MYVLKEVYGSVKEDDEWRVTSNQEIDELLKDDDSVKARPIQWLGHLTGWMIDQRMPKKILWAQFYKSRKRAPVSYTHLDVYKRQMLILFTGGPPRHDADR